MVKEGFPKNLDDLKKLKADEAIARLRHLTSGKSSGTYMRLSAALFAAYFLADTVSLFTDALVPDAPPVPAPRIARKQDEKRRSIEEFMAIINRNIFNSKGLIPDDENGLADGPARKTTLPLNLVGTVVLKNELKSIAAIEDKSQNMIFPVRIDDTIDEKIKITKIEHLKVYFINKSTGNLEYVEIIEEFPGLNPQTLRPVTSVKKPGKGDGIVQVSDTQFEIPRATVEKAISNLSEVLQQARAIPNFENGVPDGYKLLQIQPGSIYQQLGLQDGDVLVGLNGEPVNDPGKAFQLFNELKTASHIELSVKRNGVRKNMSMDIHN